MDGLTFESTIQKDFPEFKFQESTLSLPIPNSLLFSYSTQDIYGRRLNISLRDVVLGLDIYNDLDSVPAAGLKYKLSFSFNRFGNIFSVSSNSVETTAEYLNRFLAILFSAYNKNSFNIDLLHLNLVKTCHEMYLNLLGNKNVGDLKIINNIPRLADMEKYFTVRRPCSATAIIPWNVKILSSESLFSDLEAEYSSADKVKLSSKMLDVYNGVMLLNKDRILSDLQQIEPSVTHISWEAIYSIADHISPDTSEFLTYLTFSIACDKPIVDFAPIQSYIRNELPLILHDALKDRLIDTKEHTWTENESGDEIEPVTISLRRYFNFNPEHIALSDRNFREEALQYRDNISSSYSELLDRNYFLKLERESVKLREMFPYLSPVSKEVEDRIKLLLDTTEESSPVDKCGQFYSEIIQKIEPLSSTYFSLLNTYEEVRGRIPLKTFFYPRIAKDFVEAVDLEAAKIMLKEGFSFETVVDTLKKYSPVAAQEAEPAEYCSRLVDYAAIVSEEVKMNTEAIYKEVQDLVDKYRVFINTGKIKKADVVKVFANAMKDF